MRGWFFLIGLVLLTLSGCNLGAPDPTDEPIIPTFETVEPSGRPRVVIVSPSTGAEFNVDERVLVSVNATDTIGVTRVQLSANGTIVKTVSSESIAGEPTLTAVLDWTPRTTGQYDLEVVAYRGSVASDPAEINVLIREETQVIITNTPGTTGPIIPDDGVCRALTNVNLNFRSTPTTAQDNVITVLPGGTLAPIIARLPDNSWWKLQYGGLVGWVSAQFTTNYGNCAFVPIEVVATATPTLTRTSTPTPTTTLTPTITNTVPPSLPDLVVPNIVLEDDPVIPSGESEVTVTIAVTVTNIGIGTSGTFETTIRIEGVDYDLGAVSGLEPGQSVVLVTDYTFTAPGDYDVRVDVDPADDVNEISEVNNRGDITITVTAE